LLSLGLGGASEGGLLLYGSFAAAIKNMKKKKKKINYVIH